MKKLAILFSAFTLFLQAEGFIPGSKNTDPETYTVHIREVSFRNSDAEWVVCANVDDFNGGEDVPMDIASVAAGEDIGIFGPGCTIAAGTYDMMRFKIRTGMTTKGAMNYVDNAQSLNDIVWVEDGATQSVTAGDPPNTYKISVNVAGRSATTVADAAADLAAREALLENVVLDSPHNEEAVGSGFTAEQIGDYFYFEGDMPLGVASFTLDADGELPSIKMSFNTAGRLEFFYEVALDAYIVALRGPDVTITIVDPSTGETNTVTMTDDEGA